MITTISDCFQLNEQEDLLKYMKYDYNSLQVTITYELLNLLSITFAENLSQSKTVKEMASNNVYHFSEADMNRQRVKRIKCLYQKRNEEHLAYLNTRHHSPKILASDSLWYEILSDFPVLKRFLTDKEPIITKKFFDELNMIYEKINSYSGYDRFHLMHKLEMSSKIEMFYKILSVIKKEKRRRKLPSEDVYKLIEGMRFLHIVPYNPPELQIILSTNNSTDLFDEIMSIPNDEKTVNSIVFNVENLIDYYTEIPSSTQNFICFLNIMCNAVVFHLFCKMEYELSIADDKIGFEFIKRLQHCEASTKYFEDFINNNNHINLSKDCRNDITFTHFKKVYNIKTEPPKSKSRF